MELEVRGRALRTRTTRPGIGFVQISSLKMFRVNSPEEEEQSTDPEEKEKSEGNDRKYITNAKVKDRKEIQRRECESKEEEEREPVRMSSQTFPNYSILIELCRHQHRKLEDIKNDLLAQPPTATNHLQHNLSYSDLDKYLAAAYYELYDQHINNAKDAIFKLHSSSSSKKTDQNLEILYEESKRVSSAPN